MSRCSTSSKTSPSPKSASFSRSSLQQLISWTSLAGGTSRSKSEANGSPKLLMTTYGASEFGSSIRAVAPRDLTGPNRLSTSLHLLQRWGEEQAGQNDPSAPAAFTN